MLHMDRAPVPDPGLCKTCAHGSVVSGARSRFWRCGLSDTDRSYPRYPALPVLRCRGYRLWGSSEPEVPGDPGGEGGGEGEGEGDGGGGGRPGSFQPGGG
jgi:hypothetical protein